MSKEALTRMMDGNEKLFGVCNGIAEYFDVDVTFVRLIWILVGCITAGAAVGAYIISALVMPRSPVIEYPPSKVE